MMTNAEKFLKDGVDLEQLDKELIDYICNQGTDNPYYTYVSDFFKEQVKPVLTEDERVILRNIPTKYWQKICRDNYGVLEIRGEYEEIDFHTDNISDFDEYNHLFQFIKERRRILNRRIIERRIKMYFDISRLLVPLLILGTIAIGEATIVLIIWLDNRKEEKRRKARTEKNIV